MFICVIDCEKEGRSCCYTLGEWLLKENLGVPCFIVLKCAGNWVEFISRDVCLVGKGVGTFVIIYCFYPPTLVCGLDNPQAMPH